MALAASGQPPLAALLPGGVPVGPGVRRVVAMSRAASPGGRDRMASESMVQLEVTVPVTVQCRRPAAGSRHGHARPRPAEADAADMMTGRD